MHKIFINNLEKCLSGIDWCDRSIRSKESWKIEHRWPADGYFFIFDNEKDALMFSLTCV